MPGTELTDAELEILAQGPPGRRWVLLEAPLDPAAGLDGFRADVEELQARGYGLLIGHPERCPPLMAPDGGLDDLLDRGAKLQVNASSLIGDHDDASRSAGFDLLARGLVDVLASDAHGTHRPPCLGAALDALAARGGDGEALAAERPRQLVEHGIGVRERAPAPGAGAAPGRARAGRRS